MVEKSAAEKLMTTINADGSINAKPVKLSWWSSKFGSLLSPQDLALVSGALVAAYLFAGENAVLVCDTFTSLPAVLFSYKLLTNDRATKAAYEATICFWIIHGTLAVVDHFLLKTVWYMFVKFLLMSAVSSHVVAQIKKRNPEFAASISLESHESVKDADIAESKSKIIMQNTKEINAEQPKSTIHEATMVSKGSQTLSAAILHLARGLNQDDLSSSSKFFSPVMCRLSAGSNFSEYMEPLSPVKNNESNDPCRMLNNNEVIRFEKESVSPVYALENCLVDAHTRHKSVNVNTTSQIVFMEPFNESVNVAVANPTQENVMWVLKTNAGERIDAWPTCGYLPRNSATNIHLSIRDNQKTRKLAKITGDRMVIDYVSAPKNCDSFNPALFVNKSSKVTRKNMTVLYKRIAL